MLEELKREITKLGQEFKPQCSSASGRLAAKVDREDWLRFIEFAYRENTLAYTRLRCLTAAKRDEGGLEVVAELVSPYWPEILSVRTLLDPGKALPSLLRLWPYADWLEWEMRDLFGVRIEGGLPDRPFLRSLSGPSPRSGKVGTQ